MHKRLSEFVSSFDLLCKYQFGFRESYGTDLALKTFMNKILHAMDAGDYVLPVFLDLRKAFDTVDHEFFFRKNLIIMISG